MNAQATPSCNNATIKGSYGTKATGTIVASLPFASVGLVKVDGRGNFQRTETISSNGTILQNETEPGTYSVKQDCTVQLISNNGDTYSGTIVDGGKEVVLILNLSRSVIVETWKKVN